MKKPLLLLLICTHLLSAVGFSMSIHACSGTNVVSLFGVSLSESCLCDHEHQDHKKKCCQDKKVIVQADVHDKIANKTTTANEIKLVATVPTLHLVVDKLYSVQDAKTTYKQLYPPNYSPPLYLLNRVFRI
jgi:hypothetical protein